MSTRCQYVEGESARARAKERREKKGNLSTHADQYHSAVVVLSFFFFLFTNVIEQNKISMIVNDVPQLHRLISIIIIIIIKIMMTPRVSLLTCNSVSFVNMCAYANERAKKKNQSHIKEKRRKKEKTTYDTIHTHTQHRCRRQ